MILKGTFLHTPALGELEVRQNAYLVSKGETIVGLYDTLPPEYAAQPVEDWGDALIIPAFTDLHIHAPQIINRGIGYDTTRSCCPGWRPIPSRRRPALPIPPLPTGRGRPSSTAFGPWVLCAFPPLPPSTRTPPGVLWSCARPPASGASSAR